jgi:hypothetical protein
MSRTRPIAMLAVVLTASFCSQALAQTPPPASAALDTSAQLAKPSSRASLLGVDADSDGIRDDIEAIVAKERTVALVNEAKLPESRQAQSKERSKEQSLASLGEKREIRREPPRRNCLDYLMLSPQQQYKTDLRLKGQANGVLGTHPCDPVMSPLRERPFETDFLHLDLGPVFFRYGD